MANHPDMAQERRGEDPRGRAVSVLAVGLLVGSAFFVGLFFLFSKAEAGHHKTVTQITLIAPPPPPPPPPKEKPPEPEKEEQKIEQPQPLDKPVEQPDQAPPPGPLGLDSTGTGPGDGFGLAGRPGGRDIVLSGGGGGLGFAMFGSSTARHIAQELARNPNLRKVSYQIEVRVWVDAQGRFQRAELVKGAGDSALDSEIRAGLSQLTSLQQAVPANLPQPLRIRVTSSDA